MSSRQLRAVLAVAEYRSFIAAATSLRVSQPALTRTIKQIERSLGVVLFLRSTRHVTVTPAGRELAALAERLLSDLKIGIASVRELAAEERGQIIVTSVLSLGSATLPELIANYRRRFPGVEIHLREGFQGGVRDDVRSGSADFGVGYVEDLPDAFVAERLGVETFHVVLPTDHPLAARKEIELKALKDLTLVSFPQDSQTRRLVDGATAAAGFSFRHMITVNRLPTLYSLVRSCRGAAIVPASDRPSPDVSDLVSVPLVRPSLSCQVGILRLREREMTAAAAGLLSVVRDWLRTFRRPPANHGTERRRPS